MSRRFANHIVWITGGGSGLGREMALRFAEQGADVAVSGRRVERLQEVVEAIEATGQRAFPVACDVRDADSVEEAVQQVLGHFGRLDVVVANAGLSVAGSMETLAADEWRLQFETNVIGLMNTVRSSLPSLKETKGRLVLIGSVAGFVSMPGAGPYHASKFAVRSIGETLSMELHGSGVTCTTIHPGFVSSEIAQVDNKGVFDPNRRDPRPAKLMWAPDRASRVMVQAIYRRKRVFVFTGHGHAVVFLGRHLSGLVHFVITRAGLGYKRR